MLAQILLILLGFLLGIVFALTAIMVHGKRDTQYVRQIIESPESFCENGCKYRQEADEKFKDPDDCWKWLDDHHCSRHCPVIEAQIMLFEAEQKEKEQEKE